MHAHGHEGTKSMPGDLQALAEMKTRIRAFFVKQANIKWRPSTGERVLAGCRGSFHAREKKLNEQSKL
jgi:hypothetical protein